MTEYDYSLFTNSNPGQLSASFLGIPMSQIWLDLMLWERFFNAHAVKCCIELGTGCGAFSTYLALQCYQRGIAFHTFDNQNKFFDIAMPVPKLLGNVHFYHLDIKADALPIIANIKQHTGPGVVLFCDNGDKPLEYKLFAPLLGLGDYIVVHDWDYEFGPANLHGVTVEMIEGDLCAKLLSVTRWFKVIKHD